MTDIYIERDEDGSWGLVLEDGDLVLTHTVSRAVEVTQRVVFRLSTWLGESVYERDTGVPYEQAVFGDTPANGIGVYLVQIIRDTEGVDGIIGDPVFDFDVSTRTLSIAVDIQVGDETGEIRTVLAA